MATPKPREKDRFFLSPSVDHPRIVRAFLAAFVLAAFILLLAGAVPLGRRLVCGFQVNQGEAANVEFSRLLLRGELPYPDPDRGPFLQVTYPPLFPFGQAVLFRLLHGPWLPGRLMAFLGFVGCAVLLAFWGWKHWRKDLTLALVLLFLLCPTWAAWGTMVRADTLAICFEFSAFLFLLRAGRLKKGDLNRQYLLLVAAALCTLAVFTKQSTFILVAAYGLASLLEKKWKDFLTFLAFFLLLFLPSVVVLQWWSRGFFFKHTVAWVAYGFEPGLLFHYLKNSFLPECGWLLAGVILTALWKKTSLLGKCQVLMALLAVSGMARKTSAENYYLEFILFGLFFIGEGWLSSGKISGWAQRIKPLVPQWKWIYTAANLEIIFMFFLAWGLASFNTRPWPQPPSAAETLMKAQVLALYRTPGQHLALDLDLLLIARKRLWVQPAEYTAMVEKGYWSTEPLRRRIRGKIYKTIELYDIPRQYLLPPDVVEQIERSYRIEFKGFGRKWYVPRKQ